MSSRERIALAIGPAPHIHASQSTGSIVFGVIACLIPQAFWSIWVFGGRAALVILAGIASAIIAELPFCIRLKRNTLSDGTSILTGLLVAFTMPPSIPLFVPIMASVFAIIVVKWTFGGVGANWMNPALAGITFAWLSWPNLFNQYIVPRTVSGIVGVSGATPLQIVNTKTISGGTISFVEGFSGAGLNPTDFAKDISIFLDSHFFSFFDVQIPPHYVDLFFGNRAGSIGEGSIALLLFGAIFLITFELIQIDIPLSFLASFLLLQFIFGGFSNGTGFFEGDLLFSLFSGSVVLSAFYFATDPVTSPSTRTGRIIYGSLIGILVFSFRAFGSRPEGTGFSILLINCAVPVIDETIRHIMHTNKGIKNER